MTQRIFDTDNKKDYADLWDILPDDVVKITKRTYNDICDLIWYNNDITCESPFAINWHDKTEITRPIQEATEEDIGKICYFWDNEKNEKFIGVLRRKTLQGKYICDFKGWIFHHCRRLTKQEIQELC